MACGDMWEIPGGHKALEVSGSTRGTLRVCIVVASWPFPKPPIEVARTLCTPLPSRYKNGGIDVVGEARW